MNMTHKNNKRTKYLRGALLSHYFSKNLKNYLSFESLAGLR